MANEQNLTPFEKGRSGNPKGRQPGSKNRATLFKKWAGIKTKAKHPGTGKEVMLSKEDQAVLALIEKAIVKQDVKALTLLFDSIYGKVKEQVEHSNPDGSALAQPIADAMNSFEKSLLKIYGDDGDDR